MGTTPGSGTGGVWYQLLQGSHGSSFRGGGRGVALSCFLGPGDRVWTEGPWGPQAVRGGEGSLGGATKSTSAWGCRHWGAGGQRIGCSDV